MLEENYKTLHYGIVFKEFSPFFETYNELKGWLESNGWMEKFRQEYKMLTIEPEELGPQVLTMDHLKLGFLACLIVAAVSVAAFVSKLAWSRLVIAFKEKMHKVFEEKQNFETAPVSIDKEICGSIDENSLQDVLAEVRFIVEKSLIEIEDVESNSMGDVAIESELCEDKLSSNHLKPAQESRDNVDENNLMQDDLIKVHSNDETEVEDVKSELMHKVMVVSDM